MGIETNDALTDHPRAAWHGHPVKRAAGHDVDQIANDIGMSRQMVERYMRFRDQMEIAWPARRSCKS